MAIIEGVLKEEIDRLEKNISSYKKTILSLPKGSIFIRKIGNAFYAYRKRKENGVVVSEYLGNVNNENVQQEIELSNEYKRIRNNIRIASIELDKLRKAYKAFLNQ